MSHRSDRKLHRVAAGSQHWKSTVVYFVHCLYSEHIDPQPARLLARYRVLRWNRQQCFTLYPRQRVATLIVRPGNLSQSYTVGYNKRSKVSEAATPTRYKVSKYSSAYYNLSRWSEHHNYATTNQIASIYSSCVFGSRWRLHECTSSRASQWSRKMSARPPDIGQVLER
jgi:hypothetical protein